jgi:hypothetical protein
MNHHITHTLVLHFWIGRDIAPSDFIISVTVQLAAACTRPLQRPMDTMPAG